MARARVSISLTPHELAFVVDAMRVYSEVLHADLGITEPGEVQFNDAVCDGNWHMGLIKVEEIRAQLGDGELPTPEIRQGQYGVFPGEEYVQPPEPPKRRKKRKASAASQVRKASRTGKRIARWLS
jgi:hypothetical protein